MFSELRRVAVCQDVSTTPIDVYVDEVDLVHT